ncbi:hypothetical protein C8F04DRAFT_1398061 [Mycena alexandri]|uniref:Uncharacterized protein n=1 Tax=Mycena alexandri TaxID=1745969 RepID=A0AAD6SLN6_9AGAR|nr:hypothetical protein C8F04DRAFT_1398061 [Mycena alexandri]
MSTGIGDAIFSLASPASPPCAESGALTTFLVNVPITPRPLFFPHFFCSPSSLASPASSPCAASAASASFLIVGADRDTPPPFFHSTSSLASPTSPLCAESTASTSFLIVGADRDTPPAFFTQAVVSHPPQALRVPRVPLRRLSSLPHTAPSPIFLLPNCSVTFPPTPSCTASAASTSFLVAATDPRRHQFSFTQSPASHPCAASAASTSFLVVGADRDTPRLFSVDLLAGILCIRSVRRVNLLARR